VRFAESRVVSLPQSSQRHCTVRSGRELNVQVVHSRQIGTAGKLERQLCVGKTAQDIWNDCPLVDADTENLALPVDTNNTIRGFVLRGDENGLATYAVHILDASSRLQIVQVDETELRDKEKDAMLLRDLHCNGEIGRGFSREENVHCLLREDGSEG